MLLIGAIAVLYTIFQSSKWQDDAWGADIETFGAPAPMAIVACDSS